MNFFSRQAPGSPYPHATPDTYTKKFTYQVLPKPEFWQIGCAALLTNSLSNKSSINHWRIKLQTPDTVIKNPYFLREGKEINTVTDLNRCTRQ